MNRSVNLPFAPGWSSDKGCGHGKLWSETCAECEMISLRESLAWMEPRVQRDRARLRELEVGEDKLARCAQDNVALQAQVGELLMERKP